METPDEVYEAAAEAADTADAVVEEAAEADASQAGSASEAVVGYETADDESAAAEVIEEAVEEGAEEETEAPALEAAGSEKKNAEETVTITYDANGGYFSIWAYNPDDGEWYLSSKELQIEKTYDKEDHSIGYEEPEYEGYQFKGWSFTPNGEVIEDFSYLAGGLDATYYAVWAEEISITYDANGGIFEWEDEYSNIHSANAIVWPYAKGDHIGHSDPQYEGHHFKGWSETQNGEVIEDIYELTAEEDKTYYAVWEGEITITYDANGGLFKGVYYDKGEWIDSSVRQEKIVRGDSIYYVHAERDGYVLEGWSETPDGERIENFWELTAEEDKTYYAVWKEAVTITYDANGGYFESFVWDDEMQADIPVHDPQRVEAIIKGSEVPDYSDVFREGYQIVGWSETPDGAPIDDFWTVKAEEDKTYYAVWKEAVIITYDANGGYFESSVWDAEKEEWTDGPVREEICAKGDNLNGWGPEREGYVHVGWSLTKDGEKIDEDVFDDLTAEKNTTYYAVWEKEVIITFDANGGFFLDYDEEDNEIEVSTWKRKLAKGENIWAKWPDRDGYYLIGWSSTKNGPAIDDEEFEELTAEADATYYAVWEKYRTVTFDVNSANAEFDVEDGEPGTTYSNNNVRSGEYLRWYTPVFSKTPDNKVLKGWALTPDAKTVLPSDYELTKDTDLYAIWEDAIKVTFDANGGTFEDGQAVNVIDYKNGDLLGKRARVPVTSKEGVHLFGWATTKDAKEPNVELTKTTVTGPATYYAVWLESVTATFHLDPDDADWTRTAVQVKNKKMENSALYEARGDNDHLFDYWSIGGFGGEKVNLGEYVITKDTDFYANYKDIRTVTLDAMDGYFAVEGEWRFISQTEPGKALTVLPSDIPTSGTAGERFKQWYTLDDDDNKVIIEDLNSFVPEKSMWIYAEYEKIPEYTKVTSVEVSPTSATLEEAGQTVQLKASVLPKNATDQALFWSSSDEDVATVDENGLVTAVANGTARITVRVNDGKKASSKITVAIPTPTEEPTPTPTKEPTPTPTKEPTPTPTEEPTAAPTEEPTAAPTEEPTAAPTKEPTAVPTKEPAVKPTTVPAAKPTTTPTAKPTATPTPAKAADGTAVGAGASSKAAASAITKASSDEGPSGASYAPLKARLKKATKSSITIRWDRVSGATSYVVYGNACGKGKNFQEMTRTSGTSWTCSQLADGSKLKKNTYYKFMVMAVKGKGDSEVVVSTSKTIHITTLGGKDKNFKKVKVTKKPKTMKVKKTAKVKASAVKKGKKSKKHRAVAYESSNTKVVTVTAKGKIKAVGKGTAYIYCYAQDGTYKRIKVRVKAK